MTSTDEPRGTTAVWPGAAELLAAVARARSSWLAEATSVLAANPVVAGVWLVGSLGRDEGDGFSDVDLIVGVDEPVPDILLTSPFAGLDLPGTVLYTRPKPRNAPSGGAYLAICLGLAGLPVLVDLYVWPAGTAQLPTEGSVRYQRGEVRRSELGLLALLEAQPADDSTGADPDDPASLLFLIQLAAKYHARGDQPRRTGICRQLPIPDHDSTLRLRQLLDVPALRRSPWLRSAHAAAERLLDLADTCREHASGADRRRPEPAPPLPPADGSAGVPATATPDPTC